MYVNVGEYHPAGWFHDIIVNKEDMIYIPKPSSNTNVDLSVTSYAIILQPISLRHEKTVS